MIKKQQQQNFFATKSELDFFASKLISHSIEEGRWSEIRTLNSLNSNGPLEFRIIGSADYIDLSHTQLFVTAKISNKDGSDLDASDTVAPVNNFCSSLFEHLTLELNNRSITVPSNCYRYRSFIETLLNYGAEAKDTHLAAGLFRHDESGKFDDVSSAGFKARKALVNKNGEIELSTYIHNEISNQEKFLPGFLNLTYKFHRGNDQFSLMKAATDKKNYCVLKLDLNF
jgi:hypothetical protein